MNLSKGAALFCEMGVGKTKIVIDTAEIMFLHGLIKNAIIICPLSIVDTWCQELDKHSSHSSWLTLVGCKQRRINNLSVRGRASQLHWSLINVDGVSVIKEELQQQEWGLVVVDESTTIKNRNAQRTKTIIEVFQSAPYKVIVSGNPIPKSPDEIFAQYMFLDPGIFGAAFTRFRDKYFDVDFFNKIVNFKNEEEFYRKLHSVAYRKTKQECLDLPPKVYEEILIEMTPEQSKLYLQMKQEAVAFYNDDACAAPVVITKFLRMSQIAGGIFPVTEGEKAKVLPLTPNPKLIRLLEVVEELPKNEQIVIWARFQLEIELIAAALESMDQKVVKFYGKTSATERITAREQFREGTARIFIGNPSTGGRGLNDLVGATTVIYYSNDYSAENRMQSEDRNHRNGTVKVTYIDLLMEDTIDEQVLRVLKDNKDFSEGVLNHTVVL